MTVTEAELNSRTFGCELEYEGIGQETAARAVAEVVGGTARYAGGYYGAWEVAQPDGRVWRVVSDGSLRGISSETVTPILRYSDMPILQQVVRKLREKGAKANVRTGLHVHVGIGDFNAQQVANLVKLWFKQEQLIIKALGVLPERLNHYTRPTDRAFVEKICSMANPTMDKINAAWFGHFEVNPAHYNPARYRTLNVSNLWGAHAKKTAEWRCYNGTTNAGKVRTAVLFSLLLAIRAANAKAASGKKQRPYTGSAKYDTRVFLLRLGANGEIFKLMRKHLVKHLPGNASWKNGRPA